MKSNTDSQILCILLPISLPILQVSQELIIYWTNPHSHTEM